ncbi:MAG: hypothetical protein ACTSWY_14235 [Promethearchaeota archaeon]
MKSMKIFINVWYPQEKAKDVFKKFLEIEKIFPMDKAIKPFNKWETWATKRGLKGAGIFEIKEENFETGINYFFRRLNMYKNAIEGYTFEIAASYDSEKGKTLIGKDLSEFL